MGTEEIDSQHTDSRLPGQVLGVVATPVGRGVADLSENAVGRLTFDVRFRAQVKLFGKLVRMTKLVKRLVSRFAL